MKITANRKQLIETVKTASSAISSRNVLPILNNVLIEAENGKLTVTGCNLEQRISVTANADFEGNGKITLPARKLVSVLDTVGGNEIEIDADTENFHSVIRSGKTKIKLSGINPADYPEVPVSETEQEITIDTVDLISMANNVSYAAAADDSRKALTGILIESKNNCVTLCATDGKRLAVTEMNFTVPNETGFSRIIPLPAALFFRNLTGEKTTLRFSQKQLCVQSGNVTMYSKLIEGNFPNYQQVIPRSCTECCDVETGCFLDKIAVVSLVSELNTPAALTFDAGMIRFHAETASAGVADTEMEAVYSGAGCTASFNPAFVAQAVKAAANGKFTIRWNDPLSPFVFDFGNGAMAVIMPVRKK